MNRIVISMILGLWLTSSLNATVQVAFENNSPKNVWLYIYLKGKNNRLFKKVFKVAARDSWQATWSNKEIKLRKITIKSEGKLILMEQIERNLSQSGKDAYKLVFSKLKY